MVTVKAIITDRNQLFSTSCFDLGSELKTSPRTVLRQFIQAVTEGGWVNSLSQGQQYQLKKTLSLVLPERTPYDCLEIFRKVFTNLEISSSQDNFLLHMWMLNRGLVLQNLRYDFHRRFGVKETCSNQLYLFAIHKEYQHSASSKYLRLLLREGIKLSAALSGEDLLSIVSAHGTEEELQLTLDYYRFQMKDNFREVFKKRFQELLLQNLSTPEKILTLICACKKSRLEPETWLNRIDWVQNPKCFSVVMRFLDRSNSQAFYRAHGLNVLLGAAIQGEKELREWAERMRKTGVDPLQFFPLREGESLNPIEEMLLMLGCRDACERIAREFGGNSAKSVRIPESEEFYSTYYQEAAQINLQNLNRTAWKKIDMRDKKSVKDYVSLKAHAIWNNDVHLTYVDKFMKAAFLDTVFIFRDAFEKGRGDPVVMKELLNSLVEKGPCYARRFFYTSFVDTYHKARSFSISIGNFYALPTLSRNDEERYFTPGDRKFYWRQMFNSLQFVFQYYSLTGLHEAYFDYIEGDYDYRIKEGEQKRVGFINSKPLTY